MESPSEKLKPIEKIDAICNALDKLADAQGRAKCGYVWVITDIIEALRRDVLIMEEQIKDLNKPPEVSVEVGTSEDVPTE